jgi:hypothetical protein
MRGSTSFGLSASEPIALFVRAVAFALLLPLALSGSLPVFARALGRSTVHVCHCEAGHAHCRCPVCHPERHESRFGEFIRGECGHDEPSAGSLALALPIAASFTVLRPPVSQRDAISIESLSPDVTEPPPTHPPRASLV